MGLLVPADPREDRLPKWAQALLQLERSKAAMAERELAKHLETVERSRISYGDVYQNAQYISENHGYQTVRFALDEQGHKWIHVRFSNNGEAVEISGARSLVLEPRAGNVIEVGLLEW